MNYTDINWPVQFSWQRLSDSWTDRNAYIHILKHLPAINATVIQRIKQRWIKCVTQNSKDCTHNIRKFYYNSHNSFRRKILQPFHWYADPICRAV
jgi:hypothetical protein